MREGGLGWGVVRIEQDEEGIDTEQPGRNVSAPGRMSMAPPATGDKVEGFFTVWVTDRISPEQARFLVFWWGGNIEKGRKLDL